MQILKGQELVNNLREMCDNVKERLWIVVPFIGAWNSVERIIGSKWISDVNINVKLLTDINNGYYIKRDTIQNFQHRAEIKTLNGLHAKIYIVDNKILVTSANLTGTAFSRRYEIGILMDMNNTFESIFEGWWSKIAEKVDSSWLPSIRGNAGREEPGHRDTQNFPVVASLPESLTRLYLFRNYPNKLKQYNHFKEIYRANVKRIFPKVPIYHEIDSFFNYLYKHHSDTPSRKYKKHKPRNLTDKMRIEELKKYIPQYKKWLPKSDWESARFRGNRISIVQKYLSIRNIEKLNWGDIKKVVDCIHAMGSYKIIMYKFLNPKNNDLKTIRNTWLNLIHNHSKSIEERMEDTNRQLYSFGPSSIQELISYYYPEQYPMSNENSNSGMRFFGYDV